MLSFDGKELIEERPFAGCEKCYFDDKECPFRNLPDKEFYECECIKKDIIYREAEDVGHESRD